ncbi:hypothetical protein [Nostoc sp. DSM 114167]|jgi:hypothetical protein
METLGDRIEFITERYLQGKVICHLSFVICSWLMPNAHLINPKSKI